MRDSWILIVNFNGLDTNSSKGLTGLLLASGYRQFAQDIPNIWVTEDINNPITRTGLLVADLKEAEIKPCHMKLFKVRGEVNDLTALL